MALPESAWPVTKIKPLSKLPHQDTAATLLAVSTPQPTWELYKKYSSYAHLVRVFSWIRRFINWCRKKLTMECDDKLTYQELAASRHFLITVQQHQQFPEVFECLGKKRNLPDKHPLAGLSVTIADNAIVVMGRVRQQETSQPKKMWPLSIKCQLTQLLIKTEHIRQLHPGTSVMMSILAENYYIRGLRSFLKKIYKGCPQCRRANANTMTQQMGLLPTARTAPDITAFTHVGIDFAGPFTRKEGSTRKPVHHKSYACLFVCLKTRAMYIEVTRTLETEEFMVKFRKFCNRRGVPGNVYTDNGSNFVGAKNELTEIRKLLHSCKEPAARMMAEQDIQWHFIPARAPHFGGLWEAGVWAMKVQLKKIASPYPLRQDELENLMSEVEAILNSRPLATLDAPEEDDGLVLTPGHFLIGRNLKTPPTRPANNIKIGNLCRWQLVQRLQQEFWRAWKGCYLLTMEARTKWRRQQPNAKVGDLVYVKDSTLAHGRWPLARITAVSPGADNLVRAVDINCRGKTYRRDIHHLVKLHLEEAEETEENEQDITSSPAPQYVQD